MSWFALHKTIRNGYLSWIEHKDVLLDVEVILNNGPLGYMEKTIQMPTIIPNSREFVGTTIFPEKESHRKDRDLLKWDKYPKRYKEVMWSS